MTVLDLLTWDWIFFLGGTLTGVLLLIWLFGVLDRKHMQRVRRECALKAGAGRTPLQPSRAFR